MKKRLLSVFLPLLAGMTIIGVGFSVFYFLDDTSNTASLTAQASVQAYAELGSLKMVYGETPTELSNDSKLNLIIDSVEDGGIYLQTSDISSVKLDDINLQYTVTSNDGDVTIGKTARVTMTMTVPSTFDTYLTFGLGDSKSFTASSADTNTVYTYTQDVTGLTVGSPQTIDMPSFVFGYQDGYSSQNLTKEKYEAMKNALNPETGGLNFTIDYELDWVLE